MAWYRIKKHGDNSYKYEITSEYNAEKGYSEQHSHYIGKVNDKSGKDTDHKAKSQKHDKKD